MRVTFCPGPGLPGTDVELAVGATLGALREQLAAVTGCPAALTGVLAVGAVALDDAHLTGTFPLVAGARLTVGTAPSADDGVLAAVRAERHLAVLTGPDAGLLGPVTERFEVGRGAAGLDPSDRLAPTDPLALADRLARSDRLALADPLVSARHVEVRLALGRVWLRDLGSANGTRRSRRWSGHRLVAPVPRWWSRWRGGDRVLLGSTTIELRTAVVPQPRSAGRKALLAVAGFGPALGSLALVAGTGNPALLALGALGPALATVLHRAAPAPPPSAQVDASTPAEPVTTVVAADLTASAVRAVLTGQEEPVPVRIAELAPGGTLAVCGAGAREAAATLVLAARPARVEVRGPHAAARTDAEPALPGPVTRPYDDGRPVRGDVDAPWAWAHWLATPPPGSDEVGPEIVVVDGADPRPDWGGPGRVVVLVAPDRVPSWCTARVDVATRRWSGPEGDRAFRVLAGGRAWAEQQARLVAGARSVRAAGDGGLPESVTLGELGLDSGPEGITAAWLAGGPGLRAVLGAGPSSRDVVVDLVREGPHALVAGTTGSGKSEALRALVASLALRYPPTALAFALVDFKGGAGFGALSALPHVVGTVTDLDAHEAARAIGGLAAELRARKALLARVGVTDLRDWPAHAEIAHPGRLVVVVDEFRALAEELPDLMGALVRVATQGRSLGVHLVLATQRPSGVVNAELRANVALRLALRVTDAGDSSDVIDVPDAATIPPALPGRALLRRGPGPIEEIQVALVGAGAPPVRPVVTQGAAPPAAAVTVARGGPVAGAAAPDGGGPERGPSDPDERLVAAVHAAARGWRPGAPRPTAPWLPALPDDVDLAELDRLGADVRDTARADRPPRGTPPSDHPVPTRLPFGLADEPDTQSRSLAAWDPSGGHLLAVGGPGSGRSTLLSTLAAAALDRGWAVHVVGAPPDVVDRLGEHPGLGTVCPVDDPRRFARLVTLLTAAPERTVLLVDGIEAAWEALESLARGAGATRFIELLRERAVGVAMTSASASGPWSPYASERLVLPVGDATAEELAGVPRALSGGRRGPGRAVWLPARADARVCQVARATERVPSPGDDDAPRASSGGGRPLAPPVRLARVPLEAPRPEATGARRRRLLVGLGGDSGGAVGLDPAAGGLVAGPPGSGRSTALAHLVLSASHAGLAPVTIARDGPALAAARAVARGIPFDRDAALEAIERREPHDAVVVDDLDALARLLPDVADALDALADDGAAIFAAVTTAAALSAYRGVVAALRARREGIVLGAHTPGSDEVFGSPLAWHVDPVRPAHPGRGVLQRGSRLAALQVFAPPQ